MIQCTPTCTRPAPASATITARHLPSPEIQPPRPQMQSLEARRVIARALARQWFGVFMRPATPADSWLTEGGCGRTCCGAAWEQWAPWEGWKHATVLECSLARMSFSARRQVLCQLLPPWEAWGAAATGPSPPPSPTPALCISPSEPARSLAWQAWRGGWRSSTSGSTWGTTSCSTGGYLGQGLTHYPRDLR